ncbi:MAG: hypothetical protein DRJ14_05165 [Acidobacteria bacterium]|nr:MAG: hypothetical protein DRJ14_05165 [Acidobacteriota bacterium]
MKMVFPICFSRKPRLKNSFFVTASIPCKVVYREEKQLKGNRFSLVVTLSSEELDKDGFVVDFDPVQQVLENLRNRLESEPLNQLTGEPFSMKSLLYFIHQQLDESIKTPHIIQKVYLEGDREGFGLEVI